MVGRVLGVGGWWDVRREVEGGVVGGGDVVEEEVSWWWVELAPTQGLLGEGRGRDVHYECT